MNVTIAGTTTTTTQAEMWAGEISRFSKCEGARGKQWSRVRVTGVTGPTLKQR